VGDGLVAEAGVGDDDGVGSGVEVEGAVLAGGVGADGLDGAGVLALDRDDGVGDDGAGGVEDGALDGGEGGLGEEGGCGRMAMPSARRSLRRLARLDLRWLWEGAVTVMVGLLKWWSRLGSGRKAKFKTPGRAGVCRSQRRYASVASWVCLFFESCWSLLAGL